MVESILFANNASSTLAGNINTTAVTVNLQAGTGALFPALAGAQYFIGTFTDAATRTLKEIVKVTARTADALTIVRAQEGTAAQNWSANDIFVLVNTAGSMKAIVDDINAEVAARTAADVGMIKLSDFTGANQSLIINGYQKLPGGLIIQLLGCSVPFQATTLFSFPIAFPNACLALAISAGSSIGLTAEEFQLGASPANSSQYYVTAGSSVFTGASPNLGCLGIAMGW